MKLKVEYLPIDEIKPYENNAKIHTPEQIEQIKASIEQFGMNDPIGIWSKDNIIVEGHGRLIACQELGYTEIPIIRLDDLTDEQRKAYTLIHNKTTMNSDFDYNILDSELTEITDIDMNELGFEEIDINEDDYGVDFELNSSELPKVRTITLTLSEKQYAIVKKSIDLVKDKITTDGICNENGASVYEIALEWRDNQCR